MLNSIAMDSSDAMPPSHWKAWLVCLSAGLFFFYEFFQLTIFDVVNQPLSLDFQLNASQISWMSSTYLWANILFLLPAGLIIDRFSTRHVILATMLVCVVGTFGFAVTHSFVLACCFHFLAGIGNAFCLLACVVLVAHWFPPQRQAFVVGLLVTMAFIGGMVAHTPFAYLNQRYGWRFSLLVDASLGGVIVGWLYYVVHDKPKEVLSNKQHRQALAIPGFFQALTNRQNWFAGSYTSLLNLPIMILCALWGASYLQVVHHLPEMMASNVVSLLFVGSIIGCPLVGWLSDRQGRRKPLMVVGAMMTLLIMVLLCINRSLTVFELSSLFFMIGFFSSSQVLSYPLIAESNGIQITGTATAIASVLIMGGGGVGQILFGFLMQAYHVNPAIKSYTVADFQQAMWLFPCAAVIALLVAGLLRETYCKRAN